MPCKGVSTIVLFVNLNGMMYDILSRAECTLAPYISGFSTEGMAFRGEAYCAE